MGHSASPLDRAAITALALSLSLSAHAATALALLLPRRPHVREEIPVPVDPRGLAGQSFEVPALEATADEEPTAGSSGPQATVPTGPAGHSARLEEGYKPKAQASPAGKPAREKPTAAHTDAPGTDSNGVGTALYGAAGDRSAVDLATALTRGFPQAASADPAWAQAPMGPAGDVTVVLTLDDTGKLVGSDVGAGASPALQSGIRRTLALVGGRAFTSRGKVTRLRLVATVSPDTVHDGLHGDVFAIGGSYTGNEGQAFFALAIGRRIDLKVSPR